MRFLLVALCLGMAIWEFFKGSQHHFIRGNFNKTHEGSRYCSQWLGNSWGVVAPVIPEVGRLRQEHYHDSESILGFRVGPCVLATFLLVDKTWPKMAYRRSGFSFAYGSRGRVHNGKQMWKEATSARSWEITSSTTSLKKKVIWKWGKAVNSRNLLPGMNFLQQACPCIASLNSATNWEPGVQMSEPVGDIFQSNHYTVSQKQTQIKKDPRRQHGQMLIFMT